MTTLKELYTTLKSLRDMNLPVDDKLLKAADNLEEKIIKPQIRNYAPNMIQKRKESASLVKRGGTVHRMSA